MIRQAYGGQEALLVPYTPQDLVLPPATEPIPSLCNPELPVYSRESDITAALTGHSAVIIAAPCGAGKSTQLPKIGLAAGFDLVRETQPRRSPALNVGSRILEELGVVWGLEKASESVSVQTGAGLVGQRGARMQVMTEGVLLRKEAFRATKGTNELWLLDEAHERGKYIDMLLGYGKQKRLNNPDFTLAVMSATPDIYHWSSYLTDEFGQEPAVIELTAPMYDVERRELPKSDFIKEILRAARDIYENPDAHGGSNTIQVFESGVAEINDTIDELYEKLPPEIRAATTMLPNHAKLSRREQGRVYESVDGIKIIVQTNIGKTSNTIPGTRYVITRGKERQIRLDKEGFRKLVEVDISQDDLDQQFGRTGRTSTGVAILVPRKGDKLLSRNERELHMTPEIQRTPLDEVALYLAYRGDNIRTFDFIDAPDPQNVERALQRMKTLGALDSRERITAVGRKMFAFAASPEGQRSMVESLKYPQHIRLYMAAIVAMTESGGLRQFMDYDAPKRAAEQLTEEAGSDMLACLEAFINVREKTFRELNAVDVSIDDYLRVDELLRKLATSAGVNEITEMKLPSQAERDILRRCILAGQANNIYLPYDRRRARGRSHKTSKNDTEGHRARSEGATLFRSLGASSLLREISSQSVVHPLTHQPVVGVPRTLEVYEKGKLKEKPIIEQVTICAWQDIGKLGLSDVQWEDVSYRPRGDKFVVTQEQVVGNQILDVREVLAEPGPRLRAAVIEHAKSNPGKNLLYLYKIKSETEALAHKAKLPVKKLTQDAIDAIIESITPDDVVNPSHVEELLRQHIINRQLSLESYVTKEERRNIERNAPSKLELKDMTLKVAYRQGRPLVYVRKKADYSVYESLPDVLQLEDGRDILFVYDDTRLTSAQLKNKLRSQGLL